MFGNPIGKKCILLDQCGRGTVCRVTNASMRATSGCVPEIDATMVPECDCVPVHLAPNVPGKVYLDALQIGTLVYRDMRESRKLVGEKVVFNPPATVVLWADGSKTVVKCDPKDTFNETTGVALCYMKKALGNTSRALNNALRQAKGVKK